MPGMTILSSLANRWKNTESTCARDGKEYDELATKLLCLHTDADFVLTSTLSFSLGSFDAGLARFVFLIALRI